MAMFATFKVLMKENANWRTLFLAICGIVYLLLGAIFFSAAESANEVILKKRLVDEENDFKIKYNVSEKDYRSITRTILEVEPHKSGVQWGFSGAIYFAITVVTTIGYGHSVPRTTLGKIICIFYAVLGIPLWLITIQAMGERINTGAKNLLKKVFQKLGFTVDKVSHRALIPFGIISCVIILLIGTLTFAHFEQWGYLNSAYFCVMTLSTIGFGDFVALQEGGTLQVWPQYVAFALIYIMIGLTVIGAFLNLVVLRMMVTLPETPDVSEVGGSKRNSPEPDRNFSISSDSRFDNDSQLRRISNISTHTKLSIDRACDLNWCNDSDSSHLKAKKLSTSCWSEKLCKNCEKSLSPKEGSSSSSSLYYCSREIFTAKRESLCEELNNLTNDTDSEPRIKTSSFAEIFNKNDSDSCQNLDKEIPQVKVSHIDLAFSEPLDAQSSKVNHDKEPNCSYSNYLSPCNSQFRRDRYGSGDSGYLGGAPNSTINVSQNASEEETSSFCTLPSKSDSKTDYKIDIQPMFSSSFHQCQFNIGREKYSLASPIKQKSLSATSCFSLPKSKNKQNTDDVLPLHYQCNINQTNYGNKFSNTNTLNKPRLRHYPSRQSSSVYHSDSDLTTSKFNEVFEPVKCMVETTQTSVYPLVSKDISLSNDVDYERNAWGSETRRRNFLSSSYSRLESNETETSLLNSGDFEDSSENLSKAQYSLSSKENKCENIRKTSTEVKMYNEVLPEESTDFSLKDTNSNKHLLFSNKNIRRRSFSNPASILSLVDLSTPSPFNSCSSSEPCCSCLKALSDYLNRTNEPSSAKKCKFCSTKKFIKNYSSFTTENTFKNGFSSNLNCHKKCLELICQSAYLSTFNSFLHENQGDDRSGNKCCVTPEYEEKTSQTSFSTGLSASHTNKNDSNSSLARKPNLTFFQELSA